MVSLFLVSFRGISSTPPSLHLSYQLAVGKVVDMSSRAKYTTSRMGRSSALSQDYSFAWQHTVGTTVAMLLVKLPLLLTFVSSIHVDNVITMAIPVKDSSYECE